MKKNICLIFLLEVTVLLFANDSWVSGAGGSCSIMLSGDTNVQMVSESIRITLYDDYYSMDISFLFYNHGDDVELNVGFPEYSYGTQAITELRNFRCFHNGVLVPFSEKPEKYKENYVTKSWYIRKIFFNKTNYTMTRVKYDASYSRNGFFEEIQYLYGTGGSWKGLIENISITIENKSNYWILDSKFRTGEWNTKTNKMENAVDVKYVFESISENVVGIYTTNVEPYVADSFALTISNIPNYDTL